MWVLRGVWDEGWDRETDERQQGNILVEHGKRVVGLRGSSGRMGFVSPVARRSCPSRAWRVLCVAWEYTWAHHQHPRLAQARHLPGFAPTTSFLAPLTAGSKVGKA